MQHYRLTLEDAIAKYNSGDITAKGLIHFYILIKCKPGWKLKLDYKSIAEELGMGKTAFYGAISRLREEGSIEWEAPRGILVSVSSLSTNETFRECGKDSANANCDSANANWDSANANCDSANANWDSANAEAESSKPSPDKGYGDSPYSYQLFINSLSGEERESFLKFAHEKAKAMPNPPQLVEAWIAKHHADLHKQFISSAAGREAKKEAIAKSKDWRNDPRFNEWIKASFERSEMWVQEDEAEREERNSFHRWAQQVNAYEGVCY